MIDLFGGKRSTHLYLWLLNRVLSKYSISIYNIIYIYEIQIDFFLARRLATKIYMLMMSMIM